MIEDESDWKRYRNDNSIIVLKIQKASNKIHSDEQVFEVGS